MSVQFFEKICGKIFFTLGPEKMAKYFGANFEILNGHKMGSTGPFWVIQGASTWFLSVFNAMESKKKWIWNEKKFRYFYRFSGRRHEKKIHNVGP